MKYFKYSSGVLFVFATKFHGDGCVSFWFPALFLALDIGWHIVCAPEIFLALTHEQMVPSHVHPNTDSAPHCSLGHHAVQWKIKLYWGNNNKKITF